MDIWYINQWSPQTPRFRYLRLELEADLMETLHHSLMANADQRCTALLESLEVCPDGDATGCHRMPHSTRCMMARLTWIFGETSETDCDFKGVQAGNIRISSLFLGWVLSRLWWERWPTNTSKSWTVGGTTAWASPGFWGRAALDATLVANRAGFVAGLNWNAFEVFESIYIYTIW